MKKQSKEDAQKVKEKATKTWIKDAHDFVNGGINCKEEAVLCIFKGENHQEAVLGGSKGSMEELFTNLFDKDPEMMATCLHAASRVAGRMASKPKMNQEMVTDLAAAIKAKIQEDGQLQGDMKVEVIHADDLMNKINDSGDFSDEIEAAMKAALDAFKANGSW